MLLRDDFESSKCCLDFWLSCMLDCIHICVFFLLDKLILSYLDTSSTPLDTWPICRDFKLFLIVILITVLIVGGSIGKILGPLIAYRQLMDWLRFFLAFVELSLDSSSIVLSVYAFVLDTCLDTCLDTYQHLYLSRITEHL